MLRIGLVLLSALAIVLSYPTIFSVEDPEQTAGYFQGDMKMRINGRNGLKDSTSYWPNRIVYFNVTEDFGESFSQLSSEKYI